MWPAVRVHSHGYVDFAEVKLLSLFAIQISICNFTLDSWVRTIRKFLRRFCERSGNLFRWQYWSKLLLRRKADEQIAFSSKGFSSVLLTALRTNHLQLLPLLEVPFTVKQNVMLLCEIPSNFLNKNFLSGRVFLFRMKLTPTWLQSPSSMWQGFPPKSRCREEFCSCHHPRTNAPRLQPPWQILQDRPPHLQLGHYKKRYWLANSSHLRMVHYWPARSAQPSWHRR